MCLDPSAKADPSSDVWVCSGSAITAMAAVLSFRAPKAFCRAARVSSSALRTRRAGVCPTASNKSDAELLVGLVQWVVLAGLKFMAGA